MFTYELWKSDGTRVKWPFGVFETIEGAYKYGKVAGFKGLTIERFNSSGVGVTVFCFLDAPKVEYVEIFKNGISSGIVLPLSNKVQLKSIADFSIQQSAHYGKFIRVRCYVLRDSEAALSVTATREENRARWRLAKDIITFI